MRIKHSVMELQRLTDLEHRLRDEKSDVAAETLLLLNLGEHKAATEMSEYSTSRPHDTVSYKLTQSHIVPAIRGYIDEVRMRKEKIFTSARKVQDKKHLNVRKAFETDISGNDDTLDITKPMGTPV